MADSNPPLSVDFGENDANSPKETTTPPSKNMHKHHFEKMMELETESIINNFLGLAEKIQKKHKRQAFLVACEKGRLDIVKWFIHEAPNTLRIEQPHFQHSLASATAIRNNHKDIYEYLCLSPELEANEINNIKKPNRQCLAGGQSFDLIGNLIQTRKKDTAFIVIDTIRKKQKYLNISLGKNKILKALNKSFDDEIMHYVMKDQDVERTLNYVEQNKTLQTGPVAAWLKETLLRKTIEAPNPLRKQKI